MRLNYIFSPMSCGPTAVVQRPLITSYFVNGNKGKKKSNKRTRKSEERDRFFMYSFVFCFLKSHFDRYIEMVN